MGFAVAALFFLKFWRRTREGLFLAFSGGFLLLGAPPSAADLSGIPTEERSWLYLLRLLAFLLILGSDVVAEPPWARRRLSGLRRRSRPRSRAWSAPGASP